jgi:hypothetical protein
MWLAAIQGPAASLGLSLAGRPKGNRVIFSNATFSASVRQGVYRQCAHFFDCSLHEGLDSLALSSKDDARCESTGAPILPRGLKGNIRRHLLMRSEIPAASRNVLMPGTGSSP